MPVIPAASALMRLTPRDRTLIGVLQELRYLTVTQIQQVCYPTITVASTSQRLSLLRRRGVLDCLSHRTFGDRRAFWGLTALGRAAAAELTGVPPDRSGALTQALSSWSRQARPLRWQAHRLSATSRRVAPRDGSPALAALQMDHLVSTNQVFCDLCREHRAGHLGPFRWLGSHHTYVDLGHTHLVPDAMILAASPLADLWMYLLELDRGTMSEAALAEKFERYHLMHRIAMARRDDPVWEARAGSWVLFACDDEERAAVAARLAAACGLERLWAGTARECAACLAAVAAPGIESVPAVLPDARLARLPLDLGGGVAPPGASDPEAVDARSSQAPT